MVTAGTVAPFPWSSKHLVQGLQTQQRLPWRPFAAERRQHLPVQGFEMLPGNSSLTQLLPKGVARSNVIFVLTKSGQNRQGTMHRTQDQAQSSTCLQGLDKSHESSTDQTSGKKPRRVSANPSRHPPISLPAVVSPVPQAENPTPNHLPAVFCPGRTREGPWQGRDGALQVIY